MIARSFSPTIHGTFDSSDSARVGARMLAVLPASLTVDAHDAIIGAQALDMGTQC